MYKIATIPGDGIGKEVMDSTIKVLNVLADKTGIEFKFYEYMAGDEYKEKTGIALPEKTVQGVDKSDACLFAAVGETAKEVILPLRQKFNLYANLRPAKVYPGVDALKPDVDIMIIRENTEGIYKMIGSREKTWGINVRVITSEASERIVRYAFNYARDNSRKKVTVVHKANVLDYTDSVFLEAARKVSEEYSDIEYEEQIVDACAMKLILMPEYFDVIVTTNMFGDILSDETAGLVGGLGLAPSANIGDEKAIFEPVHGSAPDIAGQGIANPVACILSSVLMLNWLGENNAADLLERAVLEVLEKGDVRTPDLGGTNKTSDMTDAIISRIK
ncbi:NAD-dependent isocitrate dehydrogenase [Candidatus Bathyarchaeota archaeon]|jgi:3-isopropylmalate dehydrogenase|nr:NAD-dependent isocitrate dehydrogenase [Candidatus Bathyarchaeota archaeon]